MLRIFQLCVPYEHDISMTEAPKGLQLAMQKLICIRNREKRRAKSEKKMKKKSKVENLCRICVRNREKSEKRRAKSGKKN